MDRVIIRRCRKMPQSVIAFLPDVPADPGNVMSYEHVGQHGEASLDFYHKETMPIKGPLPYDAAALLSELRLRGYDVQLSARMPARGRQQRPGRVSLFWLTAR